MTRAVLLALVVAAALPVAAAAQQKAAPMSAAAKIANAMSAAPASIAAHATIMDWPASPKAKPTVLRAGTNGWVCYPTPPDADGNAPECDDGAWQKWAEAYMAHKAPPPATFGVSYMLGPGGASGSNTDPYATKPTPTNEWGFDGPHVMLLLPAEALKGLPTKRTNAGPYVMFAGTPYAHVMLPIVAK